MTHFNTSSHYKDTKKEKKGPKEGKKRGGEPSPAETSKFGFHKEANRGVSYWQMMPLKLS